MESFQFAVGNPAEWDKIILRTYYFTSSSSSNLLSNYYCIIGSPIQKGSIYSTQVGHEGHASSGCQTLNVIEVTTFNAIPSFDHCVVFKGQKKGRGDQRQSAMQYQLLCCRRTFLCFKDKEFSFVKYCTSYTTVVVVVMLLSRTT